MTQVQLNGSDDLYTAYVQVIDTRDPDDGMFPFSYWLNQAYDYDDISSASKISLFVPPRSKVLRVYHQVDEALTGITAMTVGDDDTADGWIESGVITPGTAGDFVWDYDSDFCKTGKYYSTADTIDITFSGIATAGSGKIFAEVISYFEDLTDD